MQTPHRMSHRVWWLAVWMLRLAALMVAGWLGYAGLAWLRYGSPAPPSRGEADALLDSFIPVYDVAERHEIRVNAPADVTLATAREMDLQRSRVVRAIFRGRELILWSRPDKIERPRALMPFMLSIGWSVLADVPEREVVVGAVTQPWNANVVFRPLSPDQFVAFHEPGFVKIAWTLRADPIGRNQSIFRTETRVATTDTASRARFRRYWSFFSPGIILIRRLSLMPLKRDAEEAAQRKFMAPPKSPQVGGRDGPASAHTPAGTGPALLRW